MARVAAQYAYMVSSDFESPEARYALGPYTPVDPPRLGHDPIRIHPGLVADGAGRTL